MGGVDGDVARVVEVRGVFEFGDGGGVGDGDEGAVVGVWAVEFGGGGFVVAFAVGGGGELGH